MLVRIVVHTTVKVCKLRHGCNIPGLRHLGKDGYGGATSHSKKVDEDDEGEETTTVETTTVDPDLPIFDEESRENNATMALAYGPISSTCSKRGDLSFYVYYTLWRNDRMPMYVVSCTSPRAEGVDYVQAGYNYFQKNSYAPTVRYDEANFDFKYTLIMIDPDSPTRAKAHCRYYLGWAVSDIEGRSLRNGVNWQVVEGKMVKDYEAPKLEEGSGPQRYQFILYQQRYPYGPVRLAEENKESRCGFNPLNFARKNRLDIIATSVFETENK